MAAVEIDGTDFDYDVRGAGDPLLLVAGTGYPGATWRLPDLLDALARHHLVITYDHRGTGATRGDDTGYTTRGFAADALRLLDALDVGPTHVLGHSMGGRVAQWMALDEPGAVRSLLLAASGAGGGANPGQPVGLPLLAMTAMIEAGYRGYMESHIAETFFTDVFAREQPDRVGWLVEAFWENRPSVADYLKHMAARQNHDTSSRLGDIAVPTLVIVGDADVRRGPTGSHLDQSLHLHANIPEAQLRVLPGVSHGYFWQAPEVTAEAILDWTSAVGERSGAGARPDVVQAAQRQ